MSVDILGTSTNAEAWFNIALRPRKPEGSLGRTAQDGHLDSHTAPELGPLIIRIYSERKVARHGLRGVTLDVPYYTGARVAFLELPQFIWNVIILWFIFSLYYNYVLLLSK